MPALGARHRFMSQGTRARRLMLRCKLLLRAAWPCQLRPAATHCENNGRRGEPEPAAERRGRVAGAPCGNGNPQGVTTSRAQFRLRGHRSARSRVEPTATKTIRGHCPSGQASVDECASVHRCTSGTHLECSKLSVPKVRYIDIKTRHCVLRWDGGWDTWAWARRRAHRGPRCLDA